jgi:hypothetical protein
MAKKTNIKQAKINPKLTPELHKSMLLMRDLADMEKKVAAGLIPTNPTRIFKVDERIQFGAHKETYIREVYDNGLYYKIESLNVQRERNNPPQNEFHIIEWVSLFPIKFEPTNFTKIEEYRIRQYNSSIDSLLSMVYHSGVDFDVEYQREHVWKLEDKINLIDSIFNNIEIGMFVFVEREYPYTKRLEIIDGKQRLTAIHEFYEDRFQYKGYYFSQLSNPDKNKFTSHGIAYGQLENPTRKAILETFIKMNTCGKPMENKHIENVKELLKTVE